MIWLNLRRLLAQPAHAPGVVVVDLMIAADDGVPHPVLRGGRAVQGRAARARSR